MSRSTKYPIFRDEGDEDYKRLSNKKIRKWLQNEDRGFKSRKQFKHQVNPWDISDWRFRPRTEEDIKKSSRK